MGLLTAPQIADGDGCYVEGIACDLNGFAFPHGWIEWEGRIIDPTFTPTAIGKIRLPNRDLARGLRARKLAAYREGRANATSYRPVQRYTREQVYTHVIELHRRLPITYDLEAHTHGEVTHHGTPDLPRPVLAQLV